MTLRLCLLSFFFIGFGTNGAEFNEAKPLTLCEVLSRLSELNGKRVQVRAMWAAYSEGTEGRSLVAIPPCEQPTIRDGWLWKDTVDAYPVGGISKYSRRLRQRAKLAKENRNSVILATLAGTIETHEHFGTARYRGIRRPPADFVYSVARLNFTDVGDLKAVPAEHWIRYLEELAREPWAEPIDGAEGK
jgi:hypothetical protein